MSANPKCDRCGHRRHPTKTLEGHSMSYTGAYECYVKNSEGWCECFDYVKDGNRADGSPLTEALER